MAETTPNLNIPRIEPNMTANVPRDFNALADAVDSAIGDMSSVPTTAKDAAGAISELFTNVSDGKAAVAAAITDKGVPTAADDTFAEMADNIGAIPVGPDTSDATAAAGDILAPKTAYGSAGTKLTGTMVDRGNMSFTPGPTAQTIPAGKHGGGGQVAAVAVPADKVLAGTTIAGTAGTMPNRGAISQTIATQNGEYTIPQGYHSGGGKVKATFPNLTPGNIIDGVNVGGVVGTSLPVVLLLSPAFRETSATSTQWLLKKFTVNVASEVNLGFEYCNFANNGLSVYVYTKKNGVEFGTTRVSTNNSWVSVGVSVKCAAGDTLEIWGLVQNMYARCAVQNASVRNLVTSPYNGEVNL